MTEDAILLLTVLGLSIVILFVTLVIHDFLEDVGLIGKKKDK